MNVPPGGTRSPCLNGPVTSIAVHNAASVPMGWDESGGESGKAPSEVASNTKPWVWMLWVRPCTS